MIFRAIAIVLAIGACREAPKSTSEAPAPAAQAVTLSIPATSVTAGTQGMTLEAHVTGTTEQVAWTLEGPGSLSQAAGATTLYAPPACVVKPAIAKVTAATASAAASASIAITAAGAAPCIEITPFVSDAAVGEAPVTLTATTSDPNATVTWSLFGPGTLTNTTGATTSYAPPDLLGNDLNVTVTASIGADASAKAIVRAHPRWQVQLAGRPGLLAFDGSRIWVTQGSSIALVNVSDGSVAGTVTLDGRAGLMTFDGDNMWVMVERTSSMALEKLRPADGTVLLSVEIAFYPSAMAWDGSSLWLTDSNGRALTKLRPDGTVALTVTGLPAPGAGLATDGTSIWAASDGIPAVTQIRVSDGANLGNIYVGMVRAQLFVQGGALFAYPPPSYPNPPGTLVRVDAAGGFVSQTSTFGHAGLLVFDGDVVWNGYYAGASYVDKLRLSDGSTLATYHVSQTQPAISDGTHLWVAVQNGLIRL